MSERCLLEKVFALCARRGIIIPTAEIYGGLSGFFEYGPVGLRIKQKLLNLWRKWFVDPYDNIVEIEGSIVLPEKVFEASGHLEKFVDPITQCKKCGTIYRADHLIEELLGANVEGKSEEELTKIMRENNLRCPKCKGELSDVKVFNLMLKTNISPVVGNIAYLRPETAQNIFINFRRLYTACRLKLPCGIAQIGFSFRNEISPRQFLIRLRGFTQAEIELFYDPENEECKLEEISDVKLPILTREEQIKGTYKVNEFTPKELIEKKIAFSKWQVYYLAREFLFFTQELKIPKDRIRIRHLLPEETAHYSKGNFDVEIYYDGEIGWREVVGNAYRTDYDLSRHSEFSNEDLSVDVDNRKIVPHVTEPSFGIDRILLALLMLNYHDKNEDRQWCWLSLPIKLSPYIAGVFPLVSKDDLPRKAREIYEMLKEEFGKDVFYDEKGSIGRRYARADEIGVPFCITIDYQTLEDNTVTLRSRDTREQVRVKVEELKDVIRNLCKG